MSETPIICKATKDTFVRFGIVIAALLGFAGYFFYDGAIGYRVENEQVASYQAFARLGEAALHSTLQEWQGTVSRPLIPTSQEDGVTVYRDAANHSFPLPDACEGVQACPPEAQDRDAMRAGWNDCWTKYCSRRHFPVKPAEHMHDAGAIREQWLAGGIFTALGGVLIYFALRTHGRVLSLVDGQVTAAGLSFPVSAIQSIDLRQWGPGFKGVAYFTVEGKKVRVDGMTYGGFSESQGQPAERFMKAVLAEYKGEIVDYEASKT